MNQHTTRTARARKPVHCGGKTNQRVWEQREGGAGGNRATGVGATYPAADRWWYGLSPNRYFTYPNQNTLPQLDVFFPCDAPKTSAESGPQKPPFFSHAAQLGKDEADAVYLPGVCRAFLRSRQWVLGWPSGQRFLAVATGNKWRVVILTESSRSTCTGSSLR